MVPYTIKKTDQSGFKKRRVCVWFKKKMRPARLLFFVCVLLFLVFAFGKSSVDTCAAPRMLHEVFATFHKSWTNHFSFESIKPQVFMSTPQLIIDAGYQVETHKVKTDDGYILTLFRIPFGKTGNFSEKQRRQPILLQHCLLCSSNDWLLQLPTEGNESPNSLPYLLADRHFDVWLGNVRGNNYSMEHIRLSPNDHRFWNFSLHEMGTLDLPAVIDYILNETQFDQLAYVGHSMGATIFFIAMDQRPEYQKKVSKMVALAPAVYLKNCKSPARFLDLSRLFPPLKDVNLKKCDRVVPKTLNDRLKHWGPFLCSGKLPAVMCQNIMFLIVGYDYQNTLADTIRMIVGHTPSDASMKTLDHFFQFMRRGKFENFDYGPEGNQKQYGRSDPPLYNLTNVRVPVKVLYGLNDWLVVPQDSQRTIRELGNCQGSAVDFVNWNHLDFIYGKNAKVLVYDQCLDFFG